MPSNHHSRGLLVFAASALLFSACWQAPPTPPRPRSVASAELALRTGNLDALLQAFNACDGFAARGAELAGRFDPAAWQIAVGAHGREVNLPAAAAAMAARDDAAFRNAIGMREQALRADSLQGGLSVSAKRANARNYYQKGHAPLDLLTGCVYPDTAGSAQALHLRLHGVMQDKRFVARIGLDAGGVNALSATTDLAWLAPKFNEGAPRGLHASELAGLPLDFLSDRRWERAEIWVLERDGALRQLLLLRDGAEWTLAEDTRSTLEQRLSDERDRRLSYIHRRAAEFKRNTGRAPRGENELSVQNAEYVDPVARSGRLGWADFDPTPPKGLALAGPDQTAAVALEPDRDGRIRVVDDAGLAGWR